MEKSLMEKWTEIEKMNKGHFLSCEDMLFTHSTFYQYYRSWFMCSNAGKYRVGKMHKHPLIPHLHIHTSGEANGECTNHIFASSFVASFASPFVALALESVFEHESKGTNGENGSFVLTCTNMWMFVHMCKQFIHTETEAYECSCKWRGKA